METMEAGSAPTDALGPLSPVAARLPEVRAAAGGVPLVEAGADPGYLIPQDVGAWGMPNGARRVDKWKNTLTDGELSELRRLHAYAFSDDEFGKGVRFIDSTDTGQAEKYLYDHFDDFREVAGNANRLAYAGSLRVRYPWRVSTDTAQGPTKVGYSVSHTLTKTEIETNGWSAGGSLKLSIGKMGDASFSGSYSYSRTNSTAWSTADTVNSDLTVGDKQWGRIDVYNVGGTYDDYLFFCLWDLPVAAEDHRYRCLLLRRLSVQVPGRLPGLPVEGLLRQIARQPLPSRAHAAPLGRWHQGAQHRLPRRKPLGSQDSPMAAWGFTGPPPRAGPPPGSRPLHGPGAGSPRVSAVHGAA
ncbi:hypothetical protein [Streptomyces syringium]|uniref:hypothetical protein n=1 Tax=Streptomyces syringium TaxID=76729 RepID=UPI0037D29E2F